MGWRWECRPRWVVQRLLPSGSAVRVGWGWGQRGRRTEDDGVGPGRVLRGVTGRDVKRVAGIEDLFAISAREAELALDDVAPMRALTHGVR